MCLNDEADSMGFAESTRYLNHTLGKADLFLPCHSTSTNIRQSQAIKLKIAGKFCCSGWSVYEV
jgi:hypothetical protein